MNFGILDNLFRVKGEFFIYKFMNCVLIFSWGLVGFIVKGKIVCGGVDIFIFF